MTKTITDWFSSFVSRFSWLTFDHLLMLVTQLFRLTDLETYRTDVKRLNFAHRFYSKLV
jgi:hypothetical protein